MKPRKQPPENSAPSHTPGPWTWQDGSTRREKGYIRCNRYATTETGRPAGIGIAVARAFVDIGFYDEYEANARLIAAAPELLEACKDALSGSVDARSYPDGTCLDKEVRDALRAAIAKAEGKA